MEHPTWGAGHRTQTCPSCLWEGSRGGRVSLSVGRVVTIRRLPSQRIRLEPGRPKREDNDRANKNRDRDQYLEWIVAEHSRHFSPPWS